MIRGPLHPLQQQASLRLPHRIVTAGDRPVEHLASPLRRLAMLRAFGLWWAEQMLAFVPERLRQWHREPMDALVLEPSDAAGLPMTRFRILQRRRRRERQVGHFQIRRSGDLNAVRLPHAKRRPHIVALRVPAELLLRLRTVLPSMFERDVGSELRNRLDSFTPFQPDQVLWSWRIDRRDRANDLLEVTVCLIPRASLEPGLTSLVHAGLAPTRLEVGQIGDSFEVIDLPPQPRDARTRHRVALLAAPVCGALALAALVLPFIIQAVRIDAVDTAIAELQPRVAQASALQQRIDGNAGGVEAIAAEEARLGDILHAMAALTEILPDDTHLDKLTLQQRQLTISGRSAGAARLITALGANPAIRNPAFTAPVTRAEGEDFDQFVIRADIAP
jgi:general secretion pathway protein L